MLHAPIQPPDLPDAVCCCLSEYLPNSQSCCHSHQHILLCNLLNAMLWSWCANQNLIMPRIAFEIDLQLSVYQQGSWPTYMLVLHQCICRCCETPLWVRRHARSWLPTFLLMPCPVSTPSTPCAMQTGSKVILCRHPTQMHCCSSSSVRALQRWAATVGAFALVEGLTCMHQVVMPDWQTLAGQMQWTVHTCWNSILKCSSLSSMLPTVNPQ